MAWQKMTENTTQMTATGQGNGNYWFYRVNSLQMYVTDVVQCSFIVNFKQVIAGWVVSLLSI